MKVDGYITSWEETIDHDRAQVITNVRRTVTFVFMNGFGSTTVELPWNGKMPQEGDIWRKRWTMTLEPTDE